MTATVTASFGNRGQLVTPAGTQHNYVLKGRKLRAVCGDHVQWEALGNGNEALLTAIEPRRNALERTDARGNRELLAANLDYLFLVLAAEPDPDLFVADRYLCAAEMLRAHAAVIWNKSDIAPLPADVAAYADLGYPVIAASAAEKRGIGDITAALGNGIGMFVGQSGVGKSSLINRLIPDADIATGALSNSSREGRHTTTASMMRAVSAGGRIIDSPGVREFTPHIPDMADLQTGFREIYAASEVCRFADCTHLREPDCAVKAQVEQGKILARRYESYKRLRNVHSKLADREYR